MQIARSYPDMHALLHALEFAKATDDTESIRRLEILKARSTSFDGGYGTHVPLLAAITSIARPGPILELGAGRFSTLLLNAMGTAQNRKVYTLESDQHWLDGFGDLNLANHVMLHVSDGWRSWIPTIDAIEEKEWSVVFIDQSPAQIRLETLLHLKDRAEFLLVHDTRNSFFAGVDEALQQFKYKHDYMLMAPPTTVVSNVRPIPL